MDLDDIQNVVRNELNDARTYIDQEQAPKRARLERYYKGLPFGNEEDGRSQVVSRDVHDVVSSMLPSLMRIFTGARSVEFIPTGPEDVEQAEQQTDYISHIVWQMNDGFSVFYAWFKDALVKDYGIVKRWWDPSLEITHHSYTDVTEEGLLAIQAEPEAEIIELSPAGETTQEQQPLFDVKLRRVTDRGRPRIDTVPGDEFLISGTARSVHDAAVVAHSAEKSVGEIVAMGFDREIVEDFVHKSHTDNEERQVRFPQAVADESNNPTERMVLLTEAYLRLDVDEVPVLHRVFALGTQYEVPNLDFVEPVPEVPFSVLTPDPEPHTWAGEGLGSKVEDVQRIKSAIQRGTLDSLALSMFPRTAAMENEVNLDDLLSNTEVGGIVRVRRSPSEVLQEMNHTFVGKDALPMLDVYDQVREARTGASRASAGLDDKALQSSTAQAVDETFAAKRESAEMVARIFAETGVKDLYRGLLRMVVRHQNRSQVVRLRNRFVEVDPREWDVDKDVTVNVALGQGSDREKLARLLAIKETQEQILQTLGPNNPLVSLGQYSATLAQMAELSGFKDPTQFFGRLPANFQLPEPEPEPNPALLVAQAEQAKVKLEQQKLTFEAHKLMLQDERERDKLDIETAVKLVELKAEDRLEEIKQLARESQADDR